MNYTIEQLQRKLYPIYSLKAPLKLAVRENKLIANQQYRTPFMRDRDRVLYSKAFRRLSGKTQVYLSGIDDHRRTRLTHTLEVSQIARSISIPLKLDADLVEAIALGHDLGHTPFGHAGERILHEIMTPKYNHVLGDLCPLNLSDEREEISEDLLPYLGFKHNLQALKNVMQLEKNYGDYGLNLTNFTIYGIQAHSSPIYDPNIVENHDKLGYYDSFIKRGCMMDNKQFAWSLESFVVAEADEIAQRHHDVEDAIRGKLISKEEIISIIYSHFESFIPQEDLRELKNAKDHDIESFIAIISRIIVNMYVNRLIKASVTNINTFTHDEKITQVSFAERFTNYDPNDKKIRNLISYCTNENDTEFSEKAESFKRTITNRVLSSYDIQIADAKGKYIIRKIFKAFYTTPQQLPNHCVYEFLAAYNPEKFTESTIIKMAQTEGIGSVRSIFSGIVSNFDKSNSIEKLILMRIICDYIAGMTDSFAQKTYKDLYN